MSQFAPKTCKEGAWQYCTYGYDHTKYSSFDDCLKGESAKCGPEPSVVKYIVTEDYTAGIFQMKGEPVISIAREFKKGQIIDGAEKTNTAGKKFIVLDDNFAVPIEKTKEYVDESKAKSKGLGLTRMAIIAIIVAAVFMVVISD